MTKRKKPLPNGHRAIMGDRKHPKRSKDFFCTPPWGTRALFEHVLHGTFYATTFGNVWEPACGAGHMAEVLKEYCAAVYATDLHDYRYGRRWNFLNKNSSHGYDWIITNPPFRQRSEQFVLHALPRARVGVAMFLRSQWLETVGRYERIFKPYPPAIIAQFSERVPLCKGRWNPDGSTATSYCWVVWLKGHTTGTQFMWIPPGCRVNLTRSDDRIRFTARPVLPADYKESLHEGKLLRRLPQTHLGSASAAV
jgi:hypothetical protein